MAVSRCGRRWEAEEAPALVARFARLSRVAVRAAALWMLFRAQHNLVLLLSRYTTCTPQYDCFDSPALLSQSDARLPWFARLTPPLRRCEPGETSTSTARSHRESAYGRAREHKFSTVRRRTAPAATLLRAVFDYRKSIVQVSAGIDCAGGV